MSVCVSYQDEKIWLSNMRADALLAFVIEVSGPDGQKLRELMEARYPGQDLELEEVFPLADERKRWSDYFRQVGEEINNGKFGDVNNEEWKKSASQDCQKIADLLVS